MGLCPSGPEVWTLEMFSDVSSRRYGNEPVCFFCVCPSSDCRVTPEPHGDARLVSATIAPPPDRAL